MDMEKVLNPALVAEIRELFSEEVGDSADLYNTQPSGGGMQELSAVEGALGSLEIPADEVSQLSDRLFEKCQRWHNGAARKGNPLLEEGYTYLVARAMKTGVGQLSWRSIDRLVVLATLGVVKTPQGVKETLSWVKEGGLTAQEAIELADHGFDSEELKAVFEAGFMTRLRKAIKGEVVNLLNALVKGPVRAQARTSMGDRCLAPQKFLWKACQRFGANQDIILAYGAPWLRGEASITKKLIEKIGGLSSVNHDLMSLGEGKERKGEKFFELELDKVLLRWRDASGVSPAGLITRLDFFTEVERATPSKRAARAAKKAAFNTAKKPNRAVAAPQQKKNGEARNLLFRAKSANALAIKMANKAIAAGDGYIACLARAKAAQAKRLRAMAFASTEKGKSWLQRQDFHNLEWQESIAWGIRDGCKPVVEYIDRGIFEVRVPYINKSGDLLVAVAYATKNEEINILEADILLN